MDARSSALSSSAVAVTVAGAIGRSAGLLFAGELRQFRGVAHQRGWLDGVETLDEFGERERRGRGHDPDRRPGDGGSEAGRVHRRGGGHESDQHALGRRSAGGDHPRYPPPVCRRDEVGVLTDGLDEDASQPRASTRHQTDVGVQQQARLDRGPRQVLFDDSAPESAVGHDLVEARHHLRLGHHRELLEVRELEPGCVDSPEAAGVEGRPLDCMREQRPQPLALVIGEPVSVPAQALEVLRQMARERLGEAGPQDVEVASSGRTRRGQRHDPLPCAEGADRWGRSTCQRSPESECREDRPPHAAARREPRLHPSAGAVHLVPGQEHAVGKRPVSTRFRFRTTSSSRAVTGCRSRSLTLARR